MKIYSSYKEMKKDHQKETNAFPMCFAFSDKQFVEGMKKLGLNPEDTDKVYSLGSGGFYRRTDAETLYEMFERHENDLRSGMQDKGFAFEAFSYELRNHEFVVTGSVTDALDALDLTYDDVQNNPMWKQELQNAIKKEREWLRKNG